MGKYTKFFDARNRNDNLSVIGTIILYEGGLYDNITTDENELYLLYKYSHFWRDVTESEKAALSNLAFQYRADNPDFDDSEDAANICSIYFSLGYDQRAQILDEVADNDDDDFVDALLDEMFDAYEQDDEDIFQDDSAFWEWFREYFYDD